MKSPRWHFGLGAWLLGVAIAFAIAGAARPPDPLPRQLRVSWSEDPRSTMTVMWQNGVPAKGPVVEYGPTPRLGRTANARSVTYDQKTGFLYEATLRGLRPGSVCYYRAGDPALGMSATRSARTAPDGIESFTFTAFGDHGTGPVSKQNVERITAEQPAFHLLLGDLSYANGNQPVWDEWFTLIEPLAATIPLMPAIGNHENERIGLKRIGYASYLARLALPPPETWYAFTYANTRFVAFNSDDFKNPQQLAWLDLTLGRARSDPTVRWLILYMHHPLYSSNVRRLNNAELISVLRPRLERFEVDLVLAGHNHNYERSYPLRGDAVAPRVRSRFRYGRGLGVTYIVSGGGGKSLYQFTPELPAITAYRESTPHYLRVQVPVDGPLQVEAVRTADRSVMDRVTIQD